MENTGTYVTGSKSFSSFGFSPKFYFLIIEVVTRVYL